MKYNTTYTISFTGILEIYGAISLKIVFYLNPSTTRPKLNEKLTTGGGNYPRFFFASHQKFMHANSSSYRYLKTTGYWGVITFYQIFKYSFFVEWERFEIIFFVRNFARFLRIFFSFVLAEC